MAKPPAPSPSPAVLQAAEANGLGEHVRGYTAVYKTSDRRSQSNAQGALMVAGLLVVAALPLALGFLVAWWAGVAVVVVAAVALVLWLRQPKDQVHEFRGGLVARTKREVVPLRWDDVACVYQGSSQIFVNGAYMGTNHGYRLRMRDGRYVTFNGSVHESKPDKSETDADELGDAILREIPPRYLQPAVEALNAGGDVRFDGVTINLRGITVPAGTVSWHELRDLAVGSGIVWLHTAEKKPWQVKIVEIPNYPVFWTLAKELHTRAHQR
jgi:hypothetical protein